MSGRIRSATATRALLAACTDATPSRLGVCYAWQDRTCAAAAATASHTLASSRSTLQRRSLCASSTLNISKKRKLSSEPAPPTAAELPAYSTFAKLKKGARSKKGGSPSKRQNNDDDDDVRFATTTTNSELKGDEYNEEERKQEIQDAVKSGRKRLHSILSNMGRADPVILDNVQVRLPSDQAPQGEHTKNRQEVGPSYNIKEFASIGVRHNALYVTCYDPSSVKYVERAIYAAELGLAPQHITNTGEEGTLRMPMPTITSDDRKRLIAQVNERAEYARTQIRMAREEARNQIRSDQRRGIISENEQNAELRTIEDYARTATKDITNTEKRVKSRIEMPS